MKNIILPLILTLMPVAAVAQPSSWYLITGQQQDRISRMCSTHVGVEYGTDNLTQEQWNKFRTCRESMANGLVHTRPLILRPHPVRIPVQ